MECVILFRWPNGRVSFISQGDDGDPDCMAVFANIDHAVHFAEKNSFLQSVPHQVVELDEL